MNEAKIQDIEGMAEATKPAWFATDAYPRPPFVLLCRTHRLYADGNLLALVRPTRDLVRGGFGMKIHRAAHTSRERAQKKRWTTRWVVSDEFLPSTTPLDTTYTFRCVRGHTVSTTLGELVRRVNDAADANNLEVFI